MSFLELIKVIFHFLLHSKQDHGFTSTYPSFQTENMSPSCTLNFDQDPSFQTHNINEHPSEPHDNKVDTILLHNSIPSNIQNIYKPL